MSVVFFSALSTFESILLQTKHRLIIGTAVVTLFSTHFLGDAIISFNFHEQNQVGEWLWLVTAFQRWLKKANCSLVGLNMSYATAAAIVATEQGHRVVGRFMIACIFCVTVTLSLK